MLEVPPVARNKAAEAGADVWLARLDDPVAGLAEEWGLTVGTTYAEGTEAFVAAVDLAHDDERSVLVHGDVHQWNALRSGDGWALVDPDGLLAEPEYDLGILRREDPVELLDGDPWDRAHLLAERCGCDATAIWEWGVVERVSTGLLATAIDLQPEGRRMLRVAEVVSTLD